MIDAEKIYREKTREGTCGANALFSAGWTVEELQKLINDDQHILVKVNTLLGQFEDNDVDTTSINAASTLSSSTVLVSTSS